MTVRTTLEFQKLIMPAGFLTQDLSNVIKEFISRSAMRLFGTENKIGKEPGIRLSNANGVRLSTTQLGTPLIGLVVSDKIVSSLRLIRRLISLSSTER